MGSRFVSTWSRRLGSALLSAFIVAAIALALSAGRALAGGGPRDVVVVINSNSAVSCEIGAYYQQARGIPDRNVCYISCSDQELVDWTECESAIRQPILQFLDQSTDPYDATSPKIGEVVDYIVLTKGIPLKAQYHHPWGPLSVASVLLCPDDVAVDEDDPPDGVPDGVGEYNFPYGPVSNFTWGFTAPETAWSHTLFDNGDSYDIDKRYYLICRLDGFTVDQVKTLIDRSLNPALDGLFVLDRNTLDYGAYKTANSRLGDQWGSAFDYLVNNGFEVSFDGGEGFLSNECGIMGYYSWASNDVMYTFPEYTSNIFVPGSIGDTYYSYSGRTFDDPGYDPENPRPSLIADLIPRGLCGGGGYVSEPDVRTATYPTLLFERYTNGYNMAESFYAACPQVYWKTVIVGDPLMAAYATPPDVTIDLQDPVVTGVVTIPALAYDESGISKVRFYIDDEQIGPVEGDTEPPYEVQLDTTLYPIGSHTIEAIAYEDSNVATQGSDTMAITVDNEISAVVVIAHALAYPDGQMVSFHGKVVTAGTAEIGGSFYVEEVDRSSAIKVIGTSSVVRGDVVSVVGEVSTIDGSRVIVDGTASVQSTGADVPGPLMMRLCDLGGAAVGGSTAPAGRGCGARNVNLLVKVIGRVVANGDGEFYLDDDSSATPTKIICPGVSTPLLDAFVAVTGLSVTEYDTPMLSSAVRARDASDIQILQ